MSAEIAAVDAAEGPVERKIVVIGFGRRLLAAMLDTVIIFFASMMVATGAGVAGLVLGMYSPDAEEISTRFVLAAGLLVSLFYYTLSWAKGGGQTIGNFSCMMRIVATNGAPIGWGRSILRYVGFYIAIIPLSIGLLWAAFDKRRQGWHDKIARTYVIESDEHFSADDVVTFVPNDPGKGKIWLLVWGVLAIFAPSALLASHWMLGPFIHQLIKALPAGNGALPVEAKMTSAPVNSKVQFADNASGEVQTVIVHRLSHKVTHVVVRGQAKRMRPDGEERTARLVPVDQVAQVEHGMVFLKCTLPEFLELEPFIETNVELVSFPDYQHAPVDSTGMALGPTLMESYYVTESTERVPEGELGVQVGTKIESRDGETVGHLAELVVTPGSREVTHFVLERDEKQISLPLTMIEHAGRDVIYLKLDKQVVDQLPAVPARPRSGAREGSDINMVALVFDSQAQADDVMAFVRELHARGTVRVRNAALLAKAEDGTITVKERHDWDAKNGAIGGVVLGGVLGLMTGGIGLVAAPMIGAAVGAVAGRVVDRGFDDTFLKSLAERMQPGRSGLLLIVESEWRVPLQEALKGRGGVILQQELTDRLIAALTAETAETAETTEPPPTA